jgi:hypothetical protein
LLVCKNRVWKLKIKRKYCTFSCICRGQHAQHLHERAWPWAIAHYFEFVESSISSNGHNSLKQSQ